MTDSQTFEAYWRQYRAYGNTDILLCLQVILQTCPVSVPIDRTVMRKLCAESADFKMFRIFWERISQDQQKALTEQAWCFVGKYRFMPAISLNIQEDLGDGSFKRYCIAPKQAHYNQVLPWELALMQWWSLTNLPAETLAKANSDRFLDDGKFYGSMWIKNRINSIKLLAESL